MRLVVVTLIGAVWLAGCSSNAVNSEYRAADSGVLVFSTASVGSPMGFDFQYRLQGTKPDCPILVCWGRMENNPGDITERGEDFKGRETGWVGVHHLKPGTYEIFNFKVFRGNMFYAYTLSSRKELALTFTINPGRATYIGQFASHSAGRGDNDPFFFTVGDRHDRDLAIARKANPDLPAVTSAVPDTSSLDSPFVKKEEAP